MAKAKRKSNPDLIDRLHAGGVRKRVAKMIADGTGGGRSKAPKNVRSTITELRSLLEQLEDRATGGPAKRSAAGRKAAATRKRNAAKRSAAAKKGARSRTARGRR